MKRQGSDRGNAGPIASRGIDGNVRKSPMQALVGLITSARKECTGRIRRRSEAGRSEAPFEQLTADVQGRTAAELPANEYTRPNGKRQKASRQRVQS